MTDTGTTILRGKSPTSVGSFLSSISEPDVASRLKLGTCCAQLLFFPSPCHLGTAQMPGGKADVTPLLCWMVCLCALLLPLTHTPPQKLVPQDVPSYPLPIKALSLL